MHVSRSRGRARRPLLPLIAAICAVALIGGCSGAATSASDRPAPDASGTAASDTTNQAADTQPAPNDLQNDYETVIKNVLPSVVQIDAGDALGSGIIWDAQGHVVTNAHVVGKRKSFKVTVATREQPVTARLVSSFPQQDLAVIKLDTVPGGLKAAKFGDTSDVAVGQIVLAMGSPLGLSSSVTQGIVSAVGRTVSEGSSGGGTGATIANMVQTSAAINPGNSGGALVNLNSEVIGIPTLAATDPDLGGTAAPGIGFAIPVSLVKNIANQIIKNGKVNDSGRAALGIEGRTVLGPDFQPAGVAVVSTTKNSAAAAAGIKSGDIIVKIGNTEVPTITSLTEALASIRPGQRVKVSYLRNGATKSAQVTLGRM
ncbi:signal protein PDZ [Streptomyces sp. 150FB]|uniref:S1C family serine protease n=1 Tax=Streptomyces sp. 150FB TaxID=1576605 RepID=UPI000589364D|nr:trypsin-like peptidase domain-containing protein [Streptomyces sp. 150FB]KIF74129.1 signal protein PDZ [Streptomyces sp. 150FB]